MAANKIWYSSDLILPNKTKERILWKEQHAVLFYYNAHILKYFRKELPEYQKLLTNIKYCIYSINLGYCKYVV